MDEVGVELPVSPVSLFAKGAPRRSEAVLLRIAKTGCQVNEYAPTGDLNEVYEQLCRVKDVHDSKNKFCYLAIIAAPSISCGMIQSAIQQAARAGIEVLFFACKRSDDDYNLLYKGFLVSLPCASEKKTTQAACLIPITLTDEGEMRVVLEDRHEKR